MRKPCDNCGSTEGALIFRGDPYCSDNCRKALGMDREREFHELNVPVGFQTELEKRLVTLVGALVEFQGDGYGQPEGTYQWQVESDQMEFVQTNRWVGIEFNHPKPGAVTITIGPLT